MHKTYILLLGILIAVGTLSSCRKSVLPGGGGTPTPAPKPEEPQIIETSPAVVTGVTKDISTNIKGYYQAVPARYSESDKKYPVVFYFHGGGQYGNGSTDLPEVLAWGTPKLLADKKLPPSFTVNGKAHSFIFVIPQFVKFPSNEDIDALVKEAMTKFRLDTTRIYLSGFSLGAKALTNYAAYKPAQTAAIISMGGLLDINSEANAKCQAMVSAKLPIWHFHNRDDSAWAYSLAERYVQMLNSFSPAIAPLFTTFDIGEGKSHHDCWTRTTDPGYKENGVNIYEWLLKYTRS